jgi:cytoskeletal protein RodZ
MNRTGSGYSKCFSVLLLTGGLLVSGDMPLLASPPQPSSPQSNSSQVSSSQSSSNQSSSIQPSSIQTVPPQSDQPVRKQEEALPDAPQAQAAQTSSQQTTPSGAAGAKAATVKGAPVAQPAGAAVAPPRQHGHRSLLIKMGLLAGAGIAVGSVVALSERSPVPRPPGASASTH